MPLWILYAFKPDKLRLAIGVSIFFIIFAVLGMIQPDYNPVRDTVSTLALGEFGFIQTISFLIFAFALFCVGLGLGESMFKRTANLVTLAFTVFALIMVIAAVFPTNDLGYATEVPATSPTLGGAIHFFGSACLVLCVPVMLYTLLRGMRKNKFWNPYLPYTIGVLVTSFVFGGLWFLLLQYSWFFSGRDSFKNY